MTLALRTLFVGSIVIGVLAAGAAPARACSCVPPPPPLEALAQAGAVFEGRVTRIQTDTTQLRTTAQLVVLRTWKGDLPEDVTVTTASQGSLCGFSFVPDTRYVLYADGGPGDLSVSLCSRSLPTEQAGEDLAALMDVTTHEPRRGGSVPAPGSGPPPPRRRVSAPPPTPRSGGCGGCGGAPLLAPVAIVLAGARRRS